MFLEPKALNLSKVALIDDNDERVTYSDLSVLCKTLADIIHDRSVVLILADRKLDTIALYYAMQSCNHVVILLNPEQHLDMLITYIEHYRPAYIWRLRTAIPLKDEAMVVFETKTHVLIRTNFQFYDLHEQLALLLTTSGSTGNPKMVRLSRTNLASNARAFVDAISLSSYDRGVVDLPVFYTYGLAICHMHFYVGGTLLLSEKKVYEADFQNFIHKEGATNLHGVPYIYECLERDGYFERMPDSIRLMTMGGGRTNPNLHNRLNLITRERGIGFFAMYGQTEGTCILTKVPDNQDFNEPGCIGVPALGTKTFLDQSTDELCFEGPGVCLGYATCWEDLSLGDENHGILRSGDVARIDDMGKIYLTGRLKRFLKFKGIRVNLDDIEAYLEMTLGIQGACVGNDDMLICYLVETNPSEAIRDSISERFRISNRVIELRSLSQLPRNAQGKTDYGALI